MISLRQRVVWGGLIATVAGLTLSSIAIYALVRWQMLAHFDEALRSEARTLGALVEGDQDGNEFDFKGGELLAAEGHQLRLRIQLENGQVIASSPLHIADSLEPTLATDQSWSWVAADGARWRSIVVHTAVLVEEGQHPAPPPISLVVIAARPLVGLETRLSWIGQLLVLVAAATSAILAVVLAYAARRAMRPLDRFAGWIAAIDDRNLGQRLGNLDLPSELVPVADRLNHLLARLDEAFQRERSFGTAVAHELRTPIAGLRSVMEVSLHRGRDADAYRTTLSISTEMVVDLQRMIESLLLLGRLDRGQVVLRQQAIDVRKVILHAWAPLDERATERALRMRWELDAANNIETDPDLFAMVLANLFRNLVDYAAPASEGIVEFQTRPTGWTLTVTNVAHHLKPGQEALVFDRFWRGDESRTDSGQHCGLGLALCRTIVGHLGGEISAILSDGRFIMCVDVKMRPDQ